MAETQRSQTSFDFCHNPHAASILQGLQKQRSEHLLVDVILCVDGKEIPCHRNVLAACSEYFQAMFCNGHRESKEYKVEIHSVSASTLQLLIDYAYTSRVTITAENAKELLAGASFFRIEPVFDTCTKFLIDHVSAKNCLEMLELGGMLSPDLDQKALWRVMKEFAEVSKKPEFLQLTKDRLITLLSSDDLSAPEECVYTAVMTWINHDTREREKEMRELMELVRFPFMDKLFFLENVESNNAMRRFCLDIVMETRRYQLFPGQVLSPRTCPRRASDLKEALVVIGAMGGKEETVGGTTYSLYSESITMTFSAMPSTSSWTTMTMMKKNYDNGSAVAVLSTSDIIVAGGTASSGDVWLYQPELDSWSRLAQMSCNRCNYKLAVLQGKVYAVGGSPRITAPAMKSVEVYDRSLNKWTEGVTLPEPRSWHAVAVLDGNIYVMGGCGSDHKDTSTVFCFSPGDSRWRPQSDMPEETSAISAAALSGNIYVANGLQSNLLCYKPGENGGVWTVVVSTGVPHLCGMTIYYGKLYILGDFHIGSSCDSTDIVCLNPETRTLEHVGTMAEAWHGHSCVTILKG